ncbi:hypothetical protein MKEN_00800400 [Mycena kentingensis (nom. inval.)]|nr:hypothetical protein MKEN_00800400 [Mycena kentingensis (nom. inval.)]
MLVRNPRCCVVSLVIAALLFLLSGLDFQPARYLSRNAPSPGRYANIDLLKPLVNYPRSKLKWIAENQRAIHELYRCIETGNCAQNQTKVVILASYEFTKALEDGQYIGGEVVFAVSTMETLRRLGYTMLFVKNMASAAQLYQIFGDLVRMVIIFYPNQSEECLGMVECVKSAANPAGIPVWKLFSFAFFGGNANYLGEKWTLTPEVSGANSYLGYSVEPQCTKERFIPHAQRKHQAWIFTKFLMYYEPERTAWPPEFFDAAAEQTGISFLTAAIKKLGIQTPPISSKIINLVPETPTTLAAGRWLLPQDEFYDHLGHSVVLLGVGDPILSPSPYDALCLGVPYINVILAWDADDPHAKNKWHTQHDGLRDLGPPYVYHVRKGDRTEFLHAIKSALENPIDRFVRSMKIR